MRRTQATPAPILVQNEHGTIHLHISQATAPHPTKPLFTGMTRPQYLRYNSILCILLDMVHHNLLAHLPALISQPRHTKAYKDAHAAWSYFCDEHATHTPEDLYEVLLYCNAQLDADARASQIHEPADEQ